MKLPTVAICYDFDMTLSPKNMQEFAFFEELETSGDDFWREQDEFMTKNAADRVLVNMYGMIQKAKERGVAITREKLKGYGSSVVLFNGLDTWFDRINEYGKSQGVNIEHYII